MIKEDDIVLCTVKKIEGTTVFLDIEGNGEGSMSMSEIAAGRIRNIREYVVPNKKIVCKVLKIINNHPQLSLRRVTGKEREETMESYKKEKTFSSVLKTCCKEPQKIISKIKEEYDLTEFLEKVKQDPKILDKYISKEESQKLAKVLSEKKEKEKEAKKTITLKSLSDSGINEIKDILNIKDAEIHYLGSSQFSISIKDKEFKEANTKLDSLIEQISKKAKEKKLFFELKEK